MNVPGCCSPYNSEATCWESSPWALGYGVTIGIGFTFIAMGMAALSLSTEFVGLIATASFGYGLWLVLSE
jgi:hypothetical protein